jgi:hypothetical protein
MQSPIGDPTKIGGADACAFLQHPLGSYGEPGGSGDFAPINLVTTREDSNLTGPRHVDRSMSIEIFADGSRAQFRFIETWGTRSGTRARRDNPREYPRAYQSGLRVEASPASAVAIASSNFVSVTDVYQIHPDLSITKSYFRNVALAVMRFERAERRDQNA